jgi:hypothetical protein
MTTTAAIATNHTPFTVTKLSTLSPILNRNSKLCTTQADSLTSQHLLLPRNTFRLISLPFCTSQHLPPYLTPVLHLTTPSALSHSRSAPHNTFRLISLPFCTSQHLPPYLTPVLHLAVIFITSPTAQSRRLCCLLRTAFVG